MNDNFIESLIGLEISRSNLSLEMFFFIILVNLLIEN